MRRDIFQCDICGMEMSPKRLKPMKVILDGVEIANYEHTCGDCRDRVRLASESHVKPEVESV